MTTESQAAFARRMGVSRSYVTQLKREERLVMSEDGKGVEVEASLRLIESTESPAPQHTARAASHAEARGQRAQAKAPDSGNREDSNSSANQREHRTLASASLRLKLAEATKREHEAEMSRMEREKMAGNLLDREVVEFVLSDLAAIIRSSLGNMSARMAPVLLPIQTLDEMIIALDDESEAIQAEVHAALKRAAERYEGG